MTCDYTATQTRSSSRACTPATHPGSFGCVWTFRLAITGCFVIVMSSMLLVHSYFFVADNSQRENCLVSQLPSSVISDSGNTEGTEVGSICYVHKTSVAPNDLPQLPDLLIGRDEDVENITHLLRFAKHSHTKMVHIFGLPAVGKSTLAIYVGYEMASRGVAVRYINVDETHIFRHIVHVTENHGQRTSAFSDLTHSDLIHQIFSNILLSWYSHTDEKYVSTSPEGLIQWAKGLSNDTLLILDNCDPLLQNSATQKAFVKMFVVLNKASHFLRIVTTSRLKVRLLDGFKLYKLKPLDNESAIELLQSVSDVMTLNDSRTVNGLVGGIPLALKIVGSLVSEMWPPDLIIRELKQNVIDTLTPGDVRPETEKMRPVLELSFKYLDNSTQECALYLSHFPGSFSHEAPLDILSNCTDSSPVKCLTNLTDRSLLDQYSFADQCRYKFHNLIREYIIDAESRGQRSIASTVFRFIREYMFGVESQHPITSRFNSGFVRYYTQVLSNFVNTYNERPHDDENIGRFEHERHNFECLLGKVLHFQPWPLLSFVNVSRSLTSSLMLETFTISELLPVGQKILVMFEYAVNKISTQIGVSETLIVYRNLILVLRSWIHSFPAEDWPALCTETFLQQGFASRFRTILKQLAKTSYNAHDCYTELKLLYSGLSFCEYYENYNSIYYNIIIPIVELSLLFSQYSNSLLIQLAWNSFLCTFISITVGILIDAFYMSLFLDRASRTFLYLASHVVQRPIDFLLLRYNNLLPMLNILCCILSYTFLCYALKEDTIMAIFFCTCIIICDIVNLFIIRFNVHHMFTLIIIAHVYIHEFDIVHIASYYLFSLLYPYHGHIYTVLKILSQVKIFYFIWPSLKSTILSLVKSFYFIWCGLKLIILSLVKSFYSIWQSVKSFIFWLISFVTKHLYFIWQKVAPIYFFVTKLYKLCHKVC